VRDVRIDYLSTATEIVSLYAFGHPIGLHDSAEEAYDWLLTVKAIAAVSPFFKQYPYVAQWLLPCPEWLVKILYPVFAPSIRLHGRMQREAAEACKRVAASEAGSGKTPTWFGSPDTRPPTIFECILRSSLPQAEKSVTRLDHDAFTAIFGGGDPAARTMTKCTFYPSRWLDAKGKINSAKDRYYVLFHRGHRMCLGYNSATTIMLRLR
jgi:hypothetical protein